MLAWQHWEDLLCDGCGHPRDESMASEHQHAYDAEPVRCFACKAQQLLAEDFHRDGNGHGLYVSSHLDLR